MSTRQPEAESRGPYRKGKRRRALIIESATMFFAELGYVGASVRTIAEDAGISPATLFQYFGNKEGLLRAVLADWDARTAAVSPPSSERGLEYFRRFIPLMEYHLQNPRSLGLFLTMAVEAGSLSHPAREFFQNRYLNSVSLLSDHLIEAVRVGQAHPMERREADGDIRLFLASLDGLEIQWLLDPSIDLVGLVTTLVNRSIERWAAGRVDESQ